MYALGDPNDQPAYDALVRKVGAQVALDQWATAGKFRMPTKSEQAAIDRANAPKSVAVAAKAAEPDMSSWSPELREAWNRSTAASDARQAAVPSQAAQPVVVAPSAAGPDARTVRGAELQLAGDVTNRMHGAAGLPAAERTRLEAIVAAAPKAAAPAAAPVQSRAAREAELSGLAKAMSAGR